MGRSGRRRPEVGAGEVLELRVRFVTLEGEEVPVTARAGLSLRVEWTEEGLAVHEPLGETDRLLGLRSGETALRLLVWHGTHADFISPPLPLRVGTADAGPAGRPLPTAR